MKRIPAEVEKREDAASAAWGTAGTWDTTGTAIVAAIQRSMDKVSPFWTRLSRMGPSGQGESR